MMKWFVLLGILVVVHQVMCEEISRCYDDVNGCFWTNGSRLLQLQAQRACRLRNNSFLPRVTNSRIQSKLADFRAAASNLLGNGGFWIGVEATGISSFHWLDGSSLAAGGEVRDQSASDSWARFAVIRYDIDDRQFVFSARRWNDAVSSHICQLQLDASCAAGDLSINSKCYKKFNVQLSWFSASNVCLSRGGSLAVFTDTGRPAENNNLTDWLDTDRTYWIGLVKSWWRTTDEDGHPVDVQYSNWPSSNVNLYDPNSNCVVVDGNNYWRKWNCNDPLLYVCQNYSAVLGTTTTARNTKTSADTRKPVTPSINSSGTSIAATTTTRHTLKPRSTTQTTTTTSTTAGDNTIAIAISVAVPCIAIVIIVIAVLIYCFKVNNRNSQQHSSDKSANNPADDYSTLDPQTKGEQSEYISLGPHHNTGFQHQGPAADDYVTLD